MRKCLFLIFTFFTIVVASGQDSVAVYSNYVVYKGDTVNRLDNNGKKTGYWLLFKVDTTTITSITDHPPSYQSSRKPTYNAIAKGQYLKGQREGRWTFGDHDLKEIYVELNYKDNKLLSPILFYTTGNELWLKAEESQGKWTYYMWDKAKHSYIYTPQKLTLDFLFDIAGFDFNKIK
jgi:hypothetical protein